MTQTIQQYTEKYKVGDMVTNIALREVLIHGVLDAHKALDANQQFAALSAEQKAAAIKQTVEVAFQKEAQSSPLLHSAGTAEIVNAYFKGIVSPQSPQKIAALYNAVPPKELEAALVSVEQGNIMGAAQAMGDFSKAASANLGIDTLTGSFGSFLATEKNKALRDTVIETHPLNPQQQTYVQKMDTLFRRADKLDAMLRGVPEVGQDIPKFNPADYPESGKAASAPAPQKTEPAPAKPSAAVPAPSATPVAPAASAVPAAPAHEPNPALPKPHQESSAEYLARVEKILHGTVSGGQVAHAVDSAPTLRPVTTGGAAMNQMHHR